MKPLRQLPQVRSTVEHGPRPSEAQSGAPEQFTLFSSEPNRLTVPKDRPLGDACMVDRTNC